LLLCLSLFVFVVTTPAVVPIPAAAATEPAHRSDRLAQFFRPDSALFQSLCRSSHALWCTWRACKMLALQKSNATTVTTIDACELLADVVPPEVDSTTGVPSKVHAFVVCKDPRFTLAPHFLTEFESKHLLELADGNWTHSLIGDTATLSEEDYQRDNLDNAVSRVRTSSSCMLRYAQTAIVERIEHRLAMLTGLPVEQLERLNMVRYAPGEFFAEHHDGKFRERTVFIYLNDLPDGDGGETLFRTLGLRFVPRHGCAVVWSNIAPDCGEDPRMLHQGLPPHTALKFGVNCFFNVRNMRSVLATMPAFHVEKATTVDVRELCTPADTAKTAYLLKRSPKLVAVPAFASDAEVEHFLDIAGIVAVGAGEADFPGTGAGPVYFQGKGAVTVKVLEFASTCILESLEARFADVTGISIEHLGRLRITRGGFLEGLCNRGCGPTSAVICLSEHDEIFFPRLGLRVKMHCGDLLHWPNIDWDSGSPVEDMRTVRVHLTTGESPSFCLEVLYHDKRVRTPQLQRPLQVLHELPGQ